MTLVLIERTERAICRRLHLNYSRVDRVWLRQAAIKELKQ